MEKYFEMHDGTKYLLGIIENIPNGVSDTEIKNRVETTSEDSWVSLIDEVVLEPDITIDWNLIDVFDVEQN